jgi:uncharacterized membrane protein YhiD involved in acid resistance
MILEFFSSSEGQLFVALAIGLLIGAERDAKGWDRHVGPQG